MRAPRFTIAIPPDVRELNLFTILVCFGFEVAEEITYWTTETQAKPLAGQ